MLDIWLTYYGFPEQTLSPSLRSIAKLFGLAALLIRDQGPSHGKGRRWMTGKFRLVLVFRIHRKVLCKKSIVDWKWEHDQQKQIMDNHIFWKRNNNIFVQLTKHFFGGGAFLGSSCSRIHESSKMLSLIGALVGIFVWWESPHAAGAAANQAEQEQSRFGERKGTGGIYRPRCSMHQKYIHDLYIKMPLKVMPTCR